MRSLIIQNTDNFTLHNYQNKRFNIWSQDNDILYDNATFLIQIYSYHIGIGVFNVTSYQLYVYHFFVNMLKDKYFVVLYVYVSFSSADQVVYKQAMNPQKDVSSPHISN